MTSEQKHQNKLIKQYEADGYLVIKLAKTNINGIPDLLCLKPNPDTIFIEVKTKKGVLSGIQRFRINDLIKRGFNAFTSFANE